MFCPSCGNQLPDGTKFCTSCGAAQPQAPEAQPAAPAPEATVGIFNEAPVAPEVPVAPEAPVITEEAPQFAAPSFDAAPEQPPKKKKKWVAPTIISGIAVALIVALVVFFLEPLTGFYLRNFGSAEDYMVYVQKNSLGNSVSRFTSSIYKVKDAEPKSFSGNVGITIGDGAEDLIGSIAGDTNIAALTDVKFEVSGNVDEDSGAYETTIGLVTDSGETLGTHVIMDGDTVYVGAPALSDTYLELPMDSTEMPEEYQEIFDLLSNEEFLDTLPEEEELNGLLEDYIGVAFEQIEEVEKSKGPLEIDGVSQDVMMLEYEITEEVALKMVIAILEKAKEDEALKDALLPAIEYVAEEFDLDMDGEEIYDEFIDLLEDALDELEDVDAGDDEAIKITDYVDDSHEIIGRSIEIGSEEFFYATVEDGEDVASMITFRGFELAGTGTKKDGLLTADYTVSYSYEGQTMRFGTISLIDFDTAAFDENTFRGTIRITPSADLIEQIAPSGEVQSLFALLNPSLEFTISGDEENPEFALNLLAGGDVFLGINGKGTISDPSSIQLPKYTTTDPEDWAASVDQEKLGEMMMDIDLLKMLYATNTDAQVSTAPTVSSPNYYYY